MELNIKTIAKKALKQHPEVDKEGMCLGECASISNFIKIELNIKKIDSLMLDVINKNPGIVGDEHTALLITGKNIIIDTQVWQFNSENGEPTESISKRKIEFTIEEYKELGFIIL